MSRQFIFHMSDLTKAYPGGRKVLDSINLSFFPDAKIGVIGISGAGKSTLIRIMAGQDQEFTGEAWAAEGARLGYLPQEPDLDETKDVRGNVMEGVSDAQALLDRYNALAMDYTDANADELATLQDQIDGRNLWDLDSRVTMAMDALRCPPPDQDVGALSGGERRRVALCRLLLSAPDLLLLDEPTNHLDAETLAWLERHLREFPGAVLMVTHDRYFLDNVTGWILEIDQGRGLPYEGNYSAWLAQKHTRLASARKQDAVRLKALARERDWVNAAPKARQSKSRARIKAYEALHDSAQERSPSSAQIVIPPGPRLGNAVITAQNLTKGYDDRLLFEGLSFDLPAGAIVGVIGANGAGKTTLFRMMTGDVTADGGEISVGETVRLGYVDQSRMALDPAKTVWEEISDGEETLKLGDHTTASRAYVSAFNFRGTDQQKKIGSLSGGERNRVHLAKVLKESANVLLLDEPTNDLDVETLRALEEALEDFAGCAVIISHDRFFLDRIATHVLAFEGDSRVVWFEGNFGAYIEDKIRRLGAEAVVPTRVKYRPFTRRS